MYIISQNNGGLSNRIKSLVSCLRYSNENNINCILKWDILDNYNKNIHLLNCNFNLLFKINNIINIINFNLDEQNEILNNNKNKFYKSHCLMIFDKDNIPNNFYTFVSKCSIKFSTNDKYNRNIDNMYTKIPQNVIYNYLPYFKQIQLIDELQEKVEHFASQNFNEQTVSVHIRSWNRNGEKGRRDFLFNIKKFENEMKKQILENKLIGYHNIKFFLATDSQEVKDYFTKEYEYKDLIVVYSRQTDLDTSRDFPEGIQEDAIELFLLAKNKSLIGSHFSSYSEVAWWLGGCTNKVVII